MTLRTSRVITVYDQYGNPIPKVVEGLEYMQSSRSPSPYRPDLFRNIEEEETNHNSFRLVDNKELFSKSIQLIQSIEKSKNPDQSVIDEELYYNNIKRGFKRTIKSIENSDAMKLKKAMIMMKENVNNLKARPLETEIFVEEFKSFYETNN